MRIAWTRRAREQVSSARKFIAADSPRAAAAQARAILTAIYRLMDFPRMGRPGQLPGTRELVVSGTPFLVVYRLGDEIVEILMVLHGAQRWPETL